MKSLVFLVVFVFALNNNGADAQQGGGGGGGGVATCSGRRTNFAAPSEGRCIAGWADQRRVTKQYPDDFEGILNMAEIYECPSSEKRVIISNGIPNHEVTLQNSLAPCEVNWVIEIPLNPTKAQSRTEVPIRGMLAMALNGIPAYGPQESDSLNAVEGMGVQGARFWYGHTGGNLVWHVHNPQMGQENVPTDTTLLGYAMDGFPIYGPVGDTSVLDPCNGVTNADGSYQYHVRTLDQVDGNLEYCNDGSSPETNWNYILGCYSGSVENSKVFDSTTYTLDPDCIMVEDDNNDGQQPTTTASSPPPTSTPTSSGSTRVPTGVNVIVMQPDDLSFFDGWSPPPNTPSTGNQNEPFPSKNGLPNIERLRLNGLQMMQAYTASPVCGTSRYATITGKYPARALSNINDSNPAEVTIPTTKLIDNDCSRENMAAEFKSNGYRTAMIGKWHLSDINRRTYTYDSARETVKGCGFTTVEGLYIENLVADPDDFNSYSDGTFSHNMEWITNEAVKFINEESNDPFFMYFNPTVPHSSNDIGKALRDFSCQDTANGKLGFDPMIPGMTESYGSCEAYRNSIFDRSSSEEDYGSIWLDDGVGAILKALEDKGILDNTIFLFQIDHGMDAKNSLYEGGVRIPQFIYYPDKISAGTKFDAPVATIDIAATMFDFAGISPSYNIDGMSWKDLVGSSTSASFWEDARCLFFENQKDRAVRCGCYKYLDIYEQSASVSSTFQRGNQQLLSNEPTNLFDLCGGTSDYITEESSNQEAVNLLSTSPAKTTELSEALQCHLSRTSSTSSSFSVCNLDHPDDLNLQSAPNAAPTEASSASPMLQLRLDFFCISFVVVAALSVF